MWQDPPLPSENAKQAGLSDSELEMAKALVEGMSADCDPDAFRNSFKDEIMKLVDRKVEAGPAEAVEKQEAMDVAAGETTTKIIDLTELLRRSLRKGGAKPAPDAPTRKAASKKPAAKKTAPTAKVARRRAA